MSQIALQTDNGYAAANELLGAVKDRLRSARDDRRRFEPIWQHNLAFAAGKHFLKWDRNQRKLVMPPEDAARDLYTVDVITEYRMTALGELGSDDDRPELLLRRDDEPSEGFQQTLNRAVEWGWDNEWQGDTVLAEARRILLDVGTSAIRCRWDPTVGPIVQDNVPHLNGEPMFDVNAAMQAMDAGQQLEFKPIRRGRICWEPLSPFNLLVPPGIPHEMFFPWECVVRPVPLSSLRAEFGELAAGLKEDTDIGSLLGLDLNAEVADGLGYARSGPDGRSSRLRDHAWLFTYLEKPTPEHPDGRTVDLATNDMHVMRVRERMPYTGPDQVARSGIAYFHWWRVTGRFWSRGMIDVTKDIQRSFNKRRRQTHEIIDRGMPFVIVEENSKAIEKKGAIAEVVQLRSTERQPVVVQGFGPGDWQWRDIEAMRDDLEHATGLRGPRLGDNPANVTTYGQLAILNENEQVKRQPILREHQASIGHLVEDSVYDMRRYWGDSRTIDLAGDDDLAETEVFHASQIPDFAIVKIAKGAPKPRSQAAELKKVEDIYAAAVNGGATAADPDAWIQWFKESLDAGQPLDLPEVSSDDHSDKALIENHVLLQGQPVPVADYDPPDVHIPLHRSAQIEAELAGDMLALQTIQNHIEEHVQVQARIAADLAGEVAQTPLPEPIEPFSDLVEAGRPEEPPASSSPKP